MGNKHSTPEILGVKSNSNAGAPQTTNPTSANAIKHRVLVVGSGAREHAIVWKLLESPSVSHIFLAPANSALSVLNNAKLIGDHTTNDANNTSVQNTSFTSLDATNLPALAEYCEAEHINLVVVGPEQPLADGIADCLASKKIACFGPSKAAAEIESSKAFAKTFMLENQIPTATFRVFTDGEYMEALQYVNECESQQHHVVVKASGLCGGKGVYVCNSHDAARNALRILFLEQPYGEQSLPVIIEERLEGREASIMAFCDGSSYTLMPCAHDYKRRYGGDLGPNTGGMGAVAPLPASYISEQDLEFIRLHVFDRAVDGLCRAQRKFVGVLYAGMMLTTRDGQMVLEFNCRFGDPEAEVVLPLLVTDLYDVMKWCVEGYLADNEANIIWRKQTFAVGVTVCSRDYPEKRLSKPAKLSGLNACQHNVFLASAQAATDDDSSQQQQLMSTGGRVACCVALSPNPLRAFADAYADAACIQLTHNGSDNEADFRIDIGHDVIFDCLESMQGATKQTYASAGVSVDKGNAVVKRIADICRRTHIAGVDDAKFGSFGALFDLNKYFTANVSENSKAELSTSVLSQPILVSGTDGVGSKLLLAERLRRMNEIGIDLVAMCVNDILCHGASPLFFLDYYASGKLDEDSMVEVVRSIGVGCEQAGCALVGGETAELPGLYSGKKFDLAGFAVGIVDGNAALPKSSAIRSGDVLLGLESSGVHSNGYSLIRKILAGTTSAESSSLEQDDNDYDAESLSSLTITDAVYQRLIHAAVFELPPSSSDAVVVPEMGGGDAATLSSSNRIQSLGDVLLAPTRIYAKSILALLRSPDCGTHVKALAHITGGGLVENVPRVLPKHLAARIDANKWIMPNVFGWIAKHGPVPVYDMVRTFNLGIGMVLVVEHTHATDITKLLTALGERVHNIGHVIDAFDKDGSGSAERCHVDNLQSALLECIARGSKCEAAHLQQQLQARITSSGVPKSLPKTSQSVAATKNDTPNNAAAPPQTTAAESDVVEVVELERNVTVKRDVPSAATVNGSLDAEDDSPSGLAAVSEDDVVIKCPPPQQQQNDGAIQGFSNGNAASGIETAAAHSTGASAAEPARVAVLISGSGTNLQSLIDYFQRLEYNKSSVWTSNLPNSSDADNDAAAAAGQQQQPRWRPWKVALVVSNKNAALGLERARRYGIKTVVIEHSRYPTREKFDEAISCHLRRDRIDYIVLAGFMRILSRKFCEEWCGRLINIHPSLLPSFRGVNAQQQAHAARVRVAGCTVHFVEPDVDTGPIILQASVPAYPDRDTVDDLQARILEREHYILPRALDLLVGGFVRYRASTPLESPNERSYDAAAAVGATMTTETYNQNAKALPAKAENSGVTNGSSSSTGDRRRSYRHSISGLFNSSGSLTQKASSSTKITVNKLQQSVESDVGNVSGGNKSNGSVDENEKKSSGVCVWRSNVSAMR